MAELAERGVTGVAISVVDLGGITRVKTVPVARLPHAAAWGVGISPCFDTILVDDSFVRGRYAGGPVGDLRIIPDLDRLTVLAAHPGWAWAPGDRIAQDGTPHPMCGRLAALRETALLAESGFEIRAAFEIEWCLSLGSGDAYTPATTGPAYGAVRLAEHHSYMRDIIDALTAQGIAVEQLHPEYGPGQFEVSVAAEGPVACADTAVLVRETIRAVSTAHGGRATFSPKVLSEGVWNGRHLHLSLWRDGVNLMDGPTPEGEAFAAGILARLPALIPIGVPTVVGHMRLAPSHWAGSYACWGPENREAAVRMVTGASGETARAANIEVKCMDATGDPYLTVAGIMAAGRAGMEDGATLPPPVHDDPAVLSGVPRLPGLEEAVKLFETDPVLAAAFGPELVDTLATARRGELALFADSTPEAIADACRWRH